MKRAPTVFTEAVAKRVVELAGTRSARQIAAELNLNRGSLHQWCHAHGVSLKGQPTISESGAAAIKALACRYPGRVISRRTGIRYWSIRRWAENVHARLRTLAEKVGLGITWQLGKPVTIWCSIAEDLDIARAEALLSRANRNHCLDLAEQRYDAGAARIGLVPHSLGAAAVNDPPPSPAWRSRLDCPPCGRAEVL